MQTSAMKACFQIAECSFSSAKKMQTSAMKACFQIAECSFSSANIMKYFSFMQVFGLFLLYFQRKNVNLQKK